ncbi:sigma-54 interaction domain-containing protein [Eubacterium barkeri]|uniref:Arginine utilization regulatory protein n=1 Tax=Eubacterium barkeri TaxID=1528 RepID=A0A1H3AN35_EUBBA|nr:sigma 54-interacting transcriptional regulator [Eubacterium barkeri]SDX31096.1 arginine utilization regulatory protein [Eubacterium barkeri]
MDIHNNSILQFLSQCGLGALIIGSGSHLLAMNQVASDLLSHTDCQVGDALPPWARDLQDTATTGQYINPAFGIYIKICPVTPPAELPHGTSLIVFRDASESYRLAMLESAIQQIEEGIVMCDAQSRLSFLNDPAVQLDSFVAERVLGENVEDVYRLNDHEGCLLPKAMENQKALLNKRHRYATRFGKQVDTIASAHPVIVDDQILGAFNIVQDWSHVTDLHRQVMDLQDKLVKEGASGKSKRKSGLTPKYTFADIIYSSPTMQQTISQCMQVSKTDFSVMIYGETGTGKELFAQSIHNASTRSDGPFLAINCAALPENLLESLLFGAVKGAYTGAENRAGLFEQADHGTLLLDEINSMDITLQAKLLRVLQDGMIRRVGSPTEIKVDVRVISCINVPPLEAIAQNRLRQDLFYRLGVINITIPPLRERTEDIDLLTKHFIMSCNRKLSASVRNIDVQTQTLFHDYSWPGNVRELQHAIEHAMILLPEHQALLTSEFIPQSLHPRTDLPLITEDPTAEAVLPSLTGKLQDIERSTLCQVLEAHRGNVSRAAQELNMSRQNLQYRIKRYGIDVSAYRYR